MKRTFESQQGKPIVILHDITRADELAVNDALQTFVGSSNLRVSGIADSLARDFSTRRIGSRTIERLSRWCNTDGVYTASLSAARRLAIILLGLVPERLIGTDSKRVDDYNTIVSDLARGIN
jgi:hypothetical protein